MNPNDSLDSRSFETDTEVFRHADGEAPDRVLDVVNKKMSAAAFADAFGFKLEPILNELAAKRELIAFRKSAVAGRASFSEHVAAVREVCGRV